VTDRTSPSRNYGDSHAIIRITSKRLNFSPFAACYGQPDTVWGVYSGRLYALNWGDDPVAKYHALRRNAVLYDVPEHPIEISGPQAIDLLGRVFCRQVSNLGVGRARYAIACRRDGGILMDGILLRLDEGRYWYVMANGEFLPWLHAHGASLDVTITDPESWVLQIQGPSSFEVLAAVWDHEAAHALPYFHVRSCTIAGQRLLVSRTGWTGEMGFELYTQSPLADGPGLWNHLLEAGRPFGLVAGSLDSMGIRRIEAGILDNGTDMDPSMTPYQAGLGKFVDLEAGNFVGREALRRADKRPLLFGVSCPNAVPVAGMQVWVGGRRVGQVTAGAWSPYLECGVGYVRFGEPAADWVDTAVELTAPSDARARIVALPFYDPDRRIARGLCLPKTHLQSS